MESVKLRKVLKPSAILFVIFFLITSFSSFAQTKQSYRNHEEIDVGGGQKVEILKCTGDGPTEMCDCIYFTDKRQNGTRMKQNANTIKEQERAAEIAKGINNPAKKKSKTTAALNDSRPDKAIPASIVPKPHVPGAKKGVTLEEAVKQADSVARVRSQKMNESLAITAPEEDSTSMNKVVQKVSDTAGTPPLVSTSQTTGENTKPTVDSVPVKEIPAAKEPVVNAPATTNEKTTVAITSKDTAANVPAPVATVAASSAPPANTTLTPTPQAELKDSAASVAPATHVPAVAASTSQPTDTTGASKNTVTNPNAPVAKAPLIAPPLITSPVKTPDAAIVREPAANTTAATSSQTAPPISGGKDSAVIVVSNAESTQQIEDTAQTGWVKQYQNVKPAATDEAAVSKISTSEAKPSQSEPLANAEVTKPSVAAGKPTSAETANAANDAATPGSSVNPATTESAPDVKTSPAPVSGFNVIGRSAEVNLNGAWEKATIIDKETEFLYKVHYRGKSAADDEWVAVSQIRNIDSVANLNSTRPVSKPKVNVNCSFEAPAPPVSNSAQFSEKLAKRKIYESYVNAKKSNNTVKTGVTFLSFKAEEPYVNTVSISATNSIEVKLGLAPAGAMIYPVKTEYKVCEQVQGKTSSKTVNSTFACFRNKQGAWTCANTD